MNGPPSSTWPSGIPGVIELPSGRRIRGRSLRRSTAGEQPQFGLYLGRRTYDFVWEHQWLAWPDFGLPGDRDAMVTAIVLAWERSALERVEVACAGGRGRTGTALACMAIVDGIDPADAVQFVRTTYDRHAVETPWQKAFVTRFRSVRRPRRARATMSAQERPRCRPWTSVVRRRPTTRTERRP